MGIAAKVIVDATPSTLETRHRQVTLGEQEMTRLYAGKADQMIHGEIVSELKLETKPEA